MQAAVAEPPELLLFRVLREECPGRLMDGTATLTRFNITFRNQGIENVVLPPQRQTIRHLA